MRNMRKWLAGITAAGALLGASSGALGASFEDVVPGELLTDEIVDPYFGRGVEGIAEGTVVSGDVSQNNVDEFETNISPTAGAEQGFVNVFQVSGDNATVDVFILIDVNINGIELGGPVAGGSDIVFNVTTSDTAVTGTATVESVLETAVSQSLP
jgi:hypothetical protein